MGRRAGSVACLAAVFIAGCTGGGERAVPTSPTMAVEAPAAVSGGGGGGAWRPAATFPSRGDGLDFRNQLEAKYATGLGRAAAFTAVDLEGDIVWTQEYLRYRVDGCDHATAVSRVLAQVDGGAAGAVCGTSPDGAVGLPSRADTVDFRRQLETKYGAMGRSSSSAVDLEGSAVWNQEYVRYRTNACTHAAAAANVLTQIDGNAAPATCYVAPVCRFRFSPTSVQAGGAGGTSTVQVYNDSTASGCSYTASSPNSWITFPSGTTGTASGPLSYTVASNPGTPRTGSFRIDYTGGSAEVLVTQSEPPYSVSIALLDGWRSTTAGTECWVRTSATPCTLQATAALPSAIATYDWQVTYTYSSAVTRTQSNASSTFSFNEACGGTGATASGTDITMSVRLIVTDTAGNTMTVNSGVGRQAALLLKTFTCS